MQSMVPCHHLPELYCKIISLYNFLRVAIDSYEYISKYLKGNS